MASLMQVATRHMAAGVEDLNELAELCAADMGRRPGNSTLKSYRAKFRRHGAKWVEVERSSARRWYAENGDANRERIREASRRWKADNPEKNAESLRRWAIEYPAKRLLQKCMQNAKKRSLTFALSLECVAAMLAPMVCSATGLPLHWEHEGASKANPWTPSIDRLDCSKGYVPGNVRVVCWAFNCMRADFPDEVVLTLAKALVDRAPV